VKHTEKVSKYNNDLGVENQGATMVEYALLAALIAIGLITVITFLSTSLSQTFSKVSSGFG
jgi:pilus assembly protein Flp/PilA